MFRLRFFAFFLFILTGTPFGALPGYSQDAPKTNATAAEVAEIQRLNSLLEQAVTARDANTLRLFGAENAPAPNALQAQTQITHIAVLPGGALMRQHYQISTAPEEDAAPQIVTSGTQDIWLSRQHSGTFALTAKRWLAPSNAVAALSNAAREEWEVNAKSQNGAPSGLLHLVAERRGERWIALRRSRWDGVLYEPDQLAQVAARNAKLSSNDNPQDIGAWLSAQMKPLEGRSGTAHFMMQAGRHGWVGLGAVFDPSRRISKETVEQVRNLRREVEGEGYLSPETHRDFGLALARLGLMVEAGDELEKAEAMRPGLVGPERLAEANTKRPGDPQRLAAMQMQREATVGLDASHPVYIINSLIRERPQPQTPLQALRLGLEYSKLADDNNSSKYLRVAEQMINAGALQGASPGDIGWANVIYDHLKERQNLRFWKPSNLVRSALFTVRCWPNDPQTIEVLAALEEAQHTVYSGFGIPMGNTEVVLWQTQNQFQRYTSLFTNQGANEFVAALTLTKLIATQEGPLVLGEEVNVFNDDRTNMFSTIAHEYGHVAVRQLSRGRTVPIWLNEGIATAVEGGYDGYLPRVRNAAQSRRLLTWPEIYAWNVDGERAFLAYSQANSMIDYIIEKAGRESLLQMLRLIGQDVPPDAAMQQVLNTTPATLWSRWAKEGIR